jgi:DNA-binding beta-propeller fold protein YncE
MGYVLDATMQAIRPVNGIPGSSLLGQPLALPFPVAAAAFAPRGDWAVAVSAADDHTAYVLRNLGGALGIDVLDSALRGADRVLLNADASAAALVSSEARQLQLVRGLPASPSAGAPLDLSSIPGTITALAVDRAASNVLIAATSDGQGALHLAAADPQMRPRLIANFGAPTALALLHGDQDAIVADAAVNQLTLLRNFAGTPEAFLLAGERDGVSGPAGLQLSPDGRKLYIANGASRTLDVWNFETQSVEASFPLDAEPTRLAPLQGSSTFVLNEAGDHPLLLLDAADGLGVYFVPAGRDR